MCLAWDTLNNSNNQYYRFIHTVNIRNINCNFPWLCFSNENNYINDLIRGNEYGLINKN